jgi:hypothetical protein
MKENFFLLTKVSISGNPALKLYLFFAYFCKRDASPDVKLKTNPKINPKSYLLTKKIIALTKKINSKTSPVHTRS